MKDQANTQPWINSAWSDSLFILMPPFIVLLIVFLFPGIFHDGAAVSPFAWVVLVLCIDVSHVYSTLYRTYFDKESFRNNRKLYLLVPLIVFAVGILLYNIGGLVFWRIAAYLAVFHFIRQQYGFLRIYSRKEPVQKSAYYLDMITIYSLTVYPVLWWHISGPRNFSWFVEGDFYFLDAPWLLLPLKITYFVILALWLGKEIVVSLKRKKINVPRFMLMIGTGLSWYMGIIFFNGDLVFTALNVISHGIPYMALIWMYGNKKHRVQPTSEKKEQFITKIFRPRNILFFAGILFFAAYLEEGFWDSLVWSDHPGIFRIFHSVLHPSESLLAIIVPLLAVPQLTHYVLDGFIWRIGKDRFDWKKTTLGE